MRLQRTRWTAHDRTWVVVITNKEHGLPLDRIYISNKEQHIEKSIAAHGVSCMIQALREQLALGFSKSCS